MGAISFSLDESLIAFLAQTLPPCVFVETGTFKGDSLALASRYFPECHSVEYSPQYFATALLRFQGRTGIHLQPGPSPEFLRGLQAQLAGRPALFWLDAHWCQADNTAGADSQSPLLAELAAMHPFHLESILLIDDARLYLAPPPAPHRLSDWPDFSEVVQSLLRLSASHRIMVLNDVIIFYPKHIHEPLRRFAHTQGVDWLHLANQARDQASRKARARRWKRWLNPF